VKQVARRAMLTKSLLSQLNSLQTFHTPTLTPVLILKYSSFLLHCIIINVVGVVVVVVVVTASVV
jgi:hypothetical protein